VVAALGAACNEPKHAERERGRRARSQAQPGIRPGGSEQDEHRHQPADEVIARRRAGLGLKEGVVQHVEADHDARREDKSVRTARQSGESREGAVSRGRRGHRRLGHMCLLFKRACTRSHGIDDEQAALAAREGRALHQSARECARGGRTLHACPEHPRVPRDRQ